MGTVRLPAVLSFCGGGSTDADATGMGVAKSDTFGSYAII